MRTDGEGIDDSGWVDARGPALAEAAGMRLYDSVRGAQMTETFLHQWESSRRSLARQRQTLRPAGSLAQSLDVPEPVEFVARAYEAIPEEWIRRYVDGPHQTWLKTFAHWARCTGNAAVRPSEEALFQRDPVAWARVCLVDLAGPRKVFTDAFRSGHLAHIASGYEPPGAARLLSNEQAYEERLRTLQPDRHDCYLALANETALFVERIGAAAADEAAWTSLGEALPELGEFSDRATTPALRTGAVWTVLHRRFPSCLSPRHTRRHPSLRGNHAAVPAWHNALARDETKQELGAPPSDPLAAKTRYYSEAFFASLESGSRVSLATSSYLRGLDVTKIALGSGKLRIHTYRKPERNWAYDLHEHVERKGVVPTSGRFENWFRVKTVSVNARAGGRVENRLVDDPAGSHRDAITRLVGLYGEAIDYRDRPPFDPVGRDFETVEAEMDGEASRLLFATDDDDPVFGNAALVDPILTNSAPPGGGGGKAPPTPGVAAAEFQRLRALRRERETANAIAEPPAPNTEYRFVVGLVTGEAFAAGGPYRGVFACGPSVPRIVELEGRIGASGAWAFVHGVHLPYVDDEDFDAGDVTFDADIPDAGALAISLARAEHDRSLVVSLDYRPASGAVLPFVSPRPVAPPAPPRWVVAAVAAAAIIILAVAIWIVRRGPADAAPAVANTNTEIPQIVNQDPEANNTNDSRVRPRETSPGGQSTPRHGSVDRPQRLTPNRSLGEGSSHAPADEERRLTPRVDRSGMVTLPSRSVTGECRWRVAAADGRDFEHEYEPTHEDLRVTLPPGTYVWSVTVTEADGHDRLVDPKDKRTFVVPEAGASAPTLK